MEPLVSSDLILYLLEEPLVLSDLNLFAYGASCIFRSDLCLLGVIYFYDFGLLLFPLGFYYPWKNCPTVLLTEFKP
jgi:hypothetical protein